MGSQGRPEATPLGAETLGEELREEAHSFEFFQAVRLLRLLSPNREEVGGFALPSDEAARFSSTPSLAFPPGEISEITVDAEQPPWVEVTFMGLVGNSGVLPLHYSRLIHAEERAGKTALRDFLDIFQHRLISLFYRAWEKSHFFVSFERGEADPVSDRLMEMLGLGSPSLRGRIGIPDRDLLFYSGLLGVQQRSALGLEQVVRDYFQVPARVSQFVGSWYPLSEGSQCRLDDQVDENSPRLGEHTVIGDEIWDPQARACIQIGPLSRTEYDTFLPGQENHRKLKALTTYFSDGQIDFDVQLILAREDVPSFVLGSVEEEATPLGWTSWITTRPRERDADETTLSL
jgi:type VI secretion system protein ImpH